MPKHHVKFGVNYLYHDFKPEVESSRIRNAAYGQVADTTYTKLSNSHIYANEVSVYAEDNFDITSRISVNIGVALLPRYILPERMKVKQISKQVKVRLISVTETEFYYLKALNLYASTDFDFFLSQPMSFPTNVHGAGILGFEAGTTHTIVFPDYFPEENDN